LVFVIASGALSVGCKADYPSCETDKDCHGKEFCVANKCQQCRASADCPAGNDTGFHGRLAITELLVMNDDIARLVLARAEAREIQRVAVANSMRTMFADGLAKAQAGLTTIEEVLRATREV